MKKVKGIQGPEIYNNHMHINLDSNGIQFPDSTTNAWKDDIQFHIQQGTELDYLKLWMSTKNRYYTPYLNPYVEFKEVAKKFPNFYSLIEKIEIL